MSEEELPDPAGQPDSFAGHLDPDVLRVYATEPLPLATAALVEGHLDRCLVCRERLSPLVADESLPYLWERVDRRLDEPARSLLERCALRLGVPDRAARLCAAMPALRWSWWGGALLLLVLSVVVARSAASPSASLLFFGLTPALSSVGVAVVTGARFDPAYVWLAVSPLNGFTVVLLRAAAVQVLAVLLTGVCALGLPVPGPYMIGWLIPSLMLTAVCLALSSRTDTLPAIGLTLSAWVLGLAVTYRPDLLAGTLLLLPEAQLVMATVTGLAMGALVLLRDRFNRFDRQGRPFRAGVPDTGQGGLV